MKPIRSLKFVVLILSLLFGVRAARAQSLTLTSVSPNFFQAGPYTMTLTGTGFTPSCVAEIKQSYLYPVPSTTTYVSPTQLTVSGYVGASNSTTTCQADVYDAATQQTSNVVYFSTSPPPVSFSLYPNNAPAGSADITFNATNDHQAPKQIQWPFNGVTTNFYGFVLSPSSVQYYIPARLLTTPGIATISAYSSTSLPFYITGNAKVTGLSPNAASAGDADFPLTINGTGFVSGDQAQWNRTALQTTFVSATQLQALVPASLVSATGNAQVTAGYAYPTTFSIPTVHVSGKVDLEGETQTAQNVTLEFRPASGAAYTVPALLGADGSFDVRGITPGTYKLAAKGYKWLRSVIPLTVGQTPLSDVPIALLGGDANGDNACDATDFGIFLSAYNSVANIPGSGYDLRADFNDDGSVDATDFGLFVGNYNKQGDP